MRHYLYAEKAGIDLEEDEIESAWLAYRIDAADDICDEMTVMIEEIDEAAKELQRDKKKALTESKKIQLADLRCASEEKTLERVQAMKDFVKNPTQESKEDAITASRLSRASVRESSFTLRLCALLDFLSIAFVNADRFRLKVV